MRENERVGESLDTSTFADCQAPRQSVMELHARFRVRPYRIRRSVGRRYLVALSVSAIRLTSLEILRLIGNRVVNNAFEVFYRLSGRMVGFLVECLRRRDREAFQVVPDPDDYESSTALRYAVVWRVHLPNLYTIPAIPGIRQI